MKMLVLVLSAAFLAHPARAADPNSAHAAAMPLQEPHGGNATEEHATKPHEAHAAKEEPADSHGAHGAQVQKREPHAGHDAKEQPSGARATKEQAREPHAGHDVEAEPPPNTPPPAAAYSGPRHAADRLFDPTAMNRARHGLHLEHGGMRAYGVRFDRLETALDSGRDGYVWDAQAWYGGDLDKLWLETEGEGRFGDPAERAELQALWSRAVTPWFDFQAGVRYDFRPDPGRAHLVLGLQGLMPYRFEVDAAAFVSEEGDVSARLEAEYDLLVTQRLVLQPRAEVELNAQDVPELGIGSGVSDLELGLRLRYEVVPELAPYVGLEWKRPFGETADFARAEGEDTSDMAFVAGARFWF